MGVELGQFDEGSKNDPGMGARLGSRLTGMVGHGDLFDLKSSGPGSRENFRIHEGSDRLDRNRVEDFAAEDLESAVDVPDGNIEEGADQAAPNLGDDPAEPGVPARGAVAGDDVDVFGVFQQECDLA